MEHGYATPYQRQENGTYRVECQCGEVFLGALTYAKEDMNAHLDLVEVGAPITLGTMKHSEVQRLADALARDMTDTPADKALFDFLSFRLAKSRKDDRRRTDYSHEEWRDLRAMEGSIDPAQFVAIDPSDDLDARIGEGSFEEHFSR
jgi:hypothetical protein